MHVLAHPQEIGTPFMNTTSLVEKQVPFYSIFVFCFLLCRFFERNEKQKIKTKQQKYKQDHKCKQENHLVLLQKRQHRHKTLQFHCLDCKQTTQDKKTRSKS